MLKRFVKLIGGDPNKREIEKHAQVLEQINDLEFEFENLSDEAMGAKTDEFRARIAERVGDIRDPDERFETEEEALDEILPEAFALVREASKRAIGLRHYDVQMIGGVVLHQGKIAEMRTGEGKTLVATLPLYLNALTGKGVHLITVNDYLARRDARWMAPIYDLLGLSVGVLQMAARTENGKKAFIVDLERESPHEDQNQLRMVLRQEAYAADITYGTNSEFGFDYLRDNMTMRLEDRVQRGHHYAIIDEVDNVLIDEARTPLIISGPAQDEAEWYIRMAQVAKQLRDEDYEIDEKAKAISLTELGEAHVESILDMTLRDPDRPEDLTPEQMRLLGYLEQALRAQYLFKRNKDYLVQSGKVIIVDEFTGRMMPGRRWSDGLHQAVEAKEGVRVQSESVTYATITIQNYFRMYEKLAGMTGTAVTESEEFDKIYSLDVLAIPTNLEYQAMQDESGLVQLEDRDEDGYKYIYYARQTDDQRTPVFWKRKDYPDVIYRTEEAKLRAIAQEIAHYHVVGRPVLVGTTSVELSERVSSRLRAEPLRRLVQVLLLRDAWMRRHNYIEDGRVIDELQFLNGPLEQLDVSIMRKLARDLEVAFNPEEPSNLNRLLELFGLSREYEGRLASCLQAGIPHEVLNARKHTEESQIIASAGAFGAVTIATNMAGRGVDIKLGGDLAEEVLSSLHRVLKRIGYDDPYNMSMEERRQALQSLDPSEYGIYESEVNYFLRYMNEMEQVRALGGLHVIGSERHEARRIDNQLRGRSARQGDPGSSRFYLSMEDELMRLFGGQQAQGIMERMKIDDALPLEVGLVGRLVEQSQTRVEGANFDVRKHLLEYDDVLNTQRASIYAQRNRIFTKEDLTEDVTGMLRMEVADRVLTALDDEGGPWKLLAWLEQIQPTLNLGFVIFPSYTLRLLLDDIATRLSYPAESGALQDILLDVARNALEAEKQHHLATVSALLEATEGRLEEQIDERLDTVDIFFEGLRLADETDVRRPAEILSELSNAIHLPIRLSSEAQRDLRDDPDVALGEVQEQVRTLLNSQSIIRLIGAIERRLSEPLGLNASQLAEENWAYITEHILSATEALLDRRAKRFIGEDGQICKELENTIVRNQGAAVGEQVVLQLLMNMAQGARATFDKKTHRRVFQRTTRLIYTYLAAHLLEDREQDEIADDVLDHLEKAQENIRTAWGLAESSRLGDARLMDFEDDVRENILAALEEDSDSSLLDKPFKSYAGDKKQVLISELGRRALTGIYRQLLLGVITELWVDYLTQMEALRISIGLEAYAQRDPLVQYKNQAFELYQELLSNMRLGVISRMYTYRPRDLSSVQTLMAKEGVAGLEFLLDAEEPLNLDDIGEESQEEPKPVEVQQSDSSIPAAGETGNGKKRRRRRRR
jgi:preprotein translocase subunit SecA